MDKAEQAVQGQGSYPLSNGQKKRLILAAQSAYAVQSRCGLADGTFDEWRRGALADAVRETSFRAVRQSQFNDVLKYFHELAGRKAMAQSVRDPDTDKRRRALWSLEQVYGEVAEWLGGVDGAKRYAAALFERTHHTTASAATAKQVWSVIFTLRNRAAAKEKKASAENAAARRREARQ